MSDAPLYLRWAIEVDHINLAARMESYANTKAKLLNFKLCYQKARSKQERQPNFPTSRNPLGALPAEIIHLIHDEVQESEFWARVWKWGKSEACLDEECDFDEHYDEDDIAELKKQFQQFVHEEEDFDFVEGEEGVDLNDPVQKARFRDWAEKEEGEWVDSKYGKHTDMAIDTVDYLDGDDAFFAGCKRVSSTLS